MRGVVPGGMRDFFRRRGIWQRQADTATNGKFLCL